MGRDRIRMTDAEVDAFLREHWHLVLGTVGRDGRPHLVTMGYGFLDGRLVMTSFTRAQKALNLRRDARLTCLVERGMDVYGEIRGVQLVGTASLSTDPALVVGAVRAVLEQKALALGDAGVVPAGVDGHVDKRTAILVDVERVASWDHRHLADSY